MKQNTKVVVLGGIAALTMTNAASAAQDFAANSTTALAYTATANMFVTNTFSFKLSKDVAMKTDEDATSIAVNAANQKGTRTFGGTSNGGGIKDCDNTSLSKVEPVKPLLTTGCKS